MSCALAADSLAPEACSQVTGDEHDEAESDQGSRNVGATPSRDVNTNAAMTYARIIVSPAKKL